MKCQTFESSKESDDDWKCWTMVENDIWCLKMTNDNQCCTVRQLQSWRIWTMSKSLQHHTSKPAGSSERLPYHRRADASADRCICAWHLHRVFEDSNYMPASPAHKPTEFYTHIPVQHPYMHQKYHFVILTFQWANRHVSSMGMMEYVHGENVFMCQVSSTCRWLTHETSEEHRLADGFIGLPMVNGVIDTMSIIVIIMSSMTVLTV